MVSVQGAHLHATAARDEWTEEKCIQLIREYRFRPVLWDRKGLRAHNKCSNSKACAWKLIGSAMKLHEDTCKHKMVVLMSSFRREKAKLLNSVRDGDSSKMNRSTWFAFKEMSFLMDKDAERKRQLKGFSRPCDTEDDTDESNEDGEPWLKNLALKYKLPLFKEKAHMSPSSTTEIASQGRRVSETTTPETSETSMTQPKATPALSESEEEIKSFTNFIMNKMKKYSETTKNAVQQAMCEIMFKADQNFYENTAVMHQDSQQKLLLQSEPGSDNVTIIKEDYSDSE